MPEREDILNPSSRLLLSDALRPPTGYDLDIGVGTTYSLNLDALLLIPFILSSSPAGDDADAHPTRMLASLRRYADRLTVFAQAGNIHAPSTYRAFHTFLEDAVVQVTAPCEGRIFHPKIWALRFIAPGCEPRHRLVCSSRNITTETMWDAILSCDESVSDPDGQGPGVLDAAPLVDFLRALLTFPGSGALASGHRRQVGSLIASLSAIGGFEVPEPFKGGRLVPLGLPGADLDAQWPIPKGERSWGVVSPFLDPGTLRRLPRSGDTHILISRPDTLDRLAGEIDGLHRRPELKVMSSWTQPVSEENSAVESREGLHAKVLAWWESYRGHVLLGSANCTSAAFGGNIEFGVELWAGLRKRHGWISGVLGEASGLADVLEDYRPATSDAEDEEAEQRALDREIELAMARVALACPRLRVSAVAGAPEPAFRMVLDVPSATLSGLNRPGWTSTVRPLSVPETWAVQVPTNAEAAWTLTEHTRVTPWLVVEVDAVSGDATSHLTRVIKADLDLDSDLSADREEFVMRELLSDPGRILAYLVMLIAGGEAVLPEAGEPLISAHAGEASVAASAAPMPEMLEALVHLAYSDRAQLARVGRDIDVLLAETPEAPELQELRDVWGAFAPLAMSEDHEGEDRHGRF
ncbi:phospholipase D family protein [Acidipropionibacterium virtanenii]|uniref:Phospholipase D-like domain-containing protein n=1 Tax=Acidipropionibacterium virtanenii TaxID=2057246 RepID=A0A344UST4_9ACTN|nr:phospholipase D family protein [Acidipropionibacterium virtanenii]AXE38332.1 hypothetical protein JS278_01152 [Acidipropionibacterium virtanenii]